MNSGYSVGETRTHRIRRISTVSRVMAWLCLGCAIGLPTLLIGVVVFDPMSLDVWLTTTPLHALGQLPLTWQLVSMALVSIPVLMGMAVLVATYALFQGFARGEVLAPVTGGRLKRVGLFLGAMAPINIVSKGALSVVLSLPNPSGERALAITLGSDDIAVLIAGTLLIVLGWTLEEAATIADEHRQIV